MTLALVLGMLGLITLLAVLLGNSLLFHEHLAWRFVAALAGLGLLGASLWLASGQRPASQPVRLAASSTPPPAVITRAGQAPVILDIQTHKATTAIGVVILANIHFQDPDGDAETVAYELIQSTVTGVIMPPDRLDLSPQEQAQGATYTLDWECQGTAAMVEFKAVILDKAGNRSNLFPFVLDCG